MPTVAKADTSVSNTSVGCLDIEDGLIRLQLTPYFDHFLDTENEIESPELSEGFKLSTQTQNLPFVSIADSNEETVPGENSSHWFRFCLRNRTFSTQNLVLNVEPPTLSVVDFYPQKQGLPSFKTGSTKELISRDVSNVGFVFKINIAPQEKQSFYLRFNTVGYPFYRRANIADNPFFTVTLWDRDHFDKDNNQNENKFGIIIGVFLALLIYNLLLFLSAKQWAPLIYTFLISSIFIVLLALNGHLSLYAPAGYPRFNNLVIIVVYPLSFFLAALFLKAFIKLKNYPKLNLIGNIGLTIGVLLLTASHFFSMGLFAQLCDLLAIITLTYFGFIVPIYAFTKDRLELAKYVLIAQAPLILSLFDRAVFGFGLTEQYYIPYKLVTGAMIGLILQSYFMGLIAYKEKQAALKNANKHLNESNQLRLNYNSQLEKELEQKTADIRSMNIDLEQQAQKLIQLDESKSKFFANISHEFRTPLTLIEGPLTSLLERENYAEKDIISGVVKHSNSLKSLIDQILLLSELDENSLDIQASEINIVQTVQEFVAQFESLFTHKGVKLTTTANPAQIHAYVDSEKLQLIINNLISNALKFTEAAGQVEVAISSTKTTGSNNEFTSDEYVQISVIDSGNGIPTSEVDHVFDRYFQSPTSELSKSGIGTGIGLALVKELVELHAGEVKVESRSAEEFGADNSGTTFSITLPLGRAHLRDNEIISNAEIAPYNYALVSNSASEQETTSTAPKTTDDTLTTILVVDDNEDMRQHLRRLLETEHNVLTAADGLLAETALKQQRPDLIITDLMMPNRDGLEFVNAIKEQGEFANIPIIMLTARAGLHDRIRGLMAAVDDYLVKPFNGHELKARIQNLLHKQAQFKAFYQRSQVEVSASTAEEFPSIVSETFHTEVHQDFNDPELTYLKKIKDTVNERLTDPDFGVDDLAQALHLSEATLRRRLATHAKFTPAAFIRHCRLEKARQLSQQGHMRSIEELATAVGFRRPSYFARLYEKTFNCEVELCTRPSPSGNDS